MHTPNVFEILLAVVTTLLGIAGVCGVYLTIKNCGQSPQDATGFGVDSTTLLDAFLFKKIQVSCDCGSNMTVTYTDKGVFGMDCERRGCSTRIIVKHEGI